MCFSATASFGAGIVLSAIGVASIRKARKPAHILFAAIPLIFAIQQISEGFLWVYLPIQGQVFMQKSMAYSFLFFAQFFWPLWIPIATLMLEEKERRRKIQFVWVAAGIIVSVYLLIGLVSHHLQASIVGYHITYDIDYHNFFRKYSGLFYIAATVAPSFTTHVKRMWIFGTTIFISYVITAIFYEHWVVSVWCFFGSIISISIYIIIEHLNPENKQSGLQNTLAIGH